MWYSLSNERRGKCYFASLYGLSPLLPVSHPPIHPPHTHPSISAILKGVRDSGRDTCATGNVDHVTFRKYVRKGEGRGENSVCVITKHHINSSQKTLTAQNGLQMLGGVPVGAINVREQLSQSSATSVGGDSSPSHT